MEKFKTAVAALLILLMLFSAGVFIGGSQFSDGGAAVSRISLPAGAVKAGEEPPALTALYERGLLMAEFAAVSYNGEGGGAFGSAVPESVFTMAMPLVHEALSRGATLVETTRPALEAAAEGNFLCLRLPAALPYQMIYALTGEIGQAATAETAVSASLLLLAFDAEGEGTLYLSDGEVCFMSDAALSVRPAALALLAGDDALSDFRFADNLLPVSDAPAFAFPLSVSDGATQPLAAGIGDDLLYLFGFNPDRGDALSAAVVEPHGSLSIDRVGIRFAASRDGGLSAAKFIDSGKDEFDIGIYDLLSAAVGLLDRVRTLDPASFGGDASLFLKGFYKENDGYTLVFGVAVGGVEITGDNVPYFARFSARGGVFTAIEVRRLRVTRGALGRTLFSSAWQYAHASRYAGEGGLHTLRLLYRVDALPAEECVASWYCDRVQSDAARAAFAAENGVSVK